MTILTHSLAFFIGIVYPMYFLFTYKKTQFKLKTDNNYRLVDYKQTITLFWFLTILVIGVSFTKQSIDLNFYPEFNPIGIILSILILIFIILQIASSKVSTSEKAEIVLKKIRDNYHYLPKTKKEFIWFNILSISAGFCEEIIFRLFLFSYLFEHTHIIIAFVLTNLVFAITHIGSSKQNIIGAFFLGLLFSAIYYFTNNIWLSIILHSAIDINIGILGYKTYTFSKKNKLVL